MLRKNTNKIKSSADDVIFDLFAKTCVILLAALCLIPFVYIVAVSLSEGSAVLRKEVFLIPKGFTLETYVTIFKTGVLTQAMVRSILLTAAYTVFTMVMTILCAYPLSCPELRGKKYLVPFIMFTMYFSGGMIPSYLLINELGLINSYWALILPGAISTYNMIVLRTFFASVPISLKESAIIDGANDFQVLTNVVLPLSKAALATISLFYMVSRWNAYIDGVLYLNDTNKYPLQLRLKQMIQSGEMLEQLLQEGATSVATMPPQNMRAAALVFSLIPVLIVYPLIQKHFVKGVTLGSIKG